MSVSDETNEIFLGTSSISFAPMERQTDPDELSTAAEILVAIEQIQSIETSQQTHLLKKEVLRNMKHWLSNQVDADNESELDNWLLQ